MQETPETQVWSLGQEDPLEEEMATQSSILAWEIPGTEEPGGLQSMGSQRVGQTEATEQACMQACIFSPLLISNLLISSKTRYWRRKGKKGSIFNVNNDFLWIRLVNIDHRASYNPKWLLKKKKVAITISTKDSLRWGLHIDTHLIIQS